MASAPHNMNKKTERTLPPKRGKIKARIFESLVKKVVSVASKAGEAVQKNGGERSDSASATPPPSGYNSDANSEVS